MEHGLAGAAVGLALFLFPGVTWTLALAPGLGWTRALPLALVMAFTLAPGVLFTLNVLFDLPIALPTMTFLAVALGLSGVAVMVAPALRSRLAE